MLGNVPNNAYWANYDSQEMGQIIQRDFFPDLERLKAQNEYLEAVDKNDIQKLRELYAKYSSDARPPPTERCKYC